MEITDGVVTLRPFHREYASQLYKGMRESLMDLKPWMSWAPAAYSQEEARDFIAITRARWNDGNLFAFAITDAKTGDILGGCSLSHAHPVYHLCNVGYWARSSRHGEGIAGCATLLATRFGFEHGGIIRAEVVIAIDNQQSRRVAEKIGAHCEGVLLNRMVIGKAVYDVHMYSIIPQDFGLLVRL